MAETKRIYSLLSKFGLQNRIVDFDDFPDMEKVLQKIDYRSLDLQMNMLRKESQKFLAKAIKV